MCGTDCFLFLISILFPPIGVWVKRGLCSADSLINLALLCLGYLPGLLHSWYIIYKYPDPYDEYSAIADSEGGTVTYYYVQQGPAPRRGGHGYGTVNSEPAAGQFPGQQSGTTNSFPQGNVKVQEQNSAPTPAAPAPAPAPVQGGGEASSGAVTEENPPAYADVIQGDHKVQNP
ncbi:hypothetical protein K432DRAFT_113033 [Lepidopterella palustris CBS 459.81]|uniref:Stress response RCI peptide n=1 Tax=Lepidopterella palustris CBS 459.81 TaxID=1314670 RepID=A0A8E2E5T2_9PEZI|nr:hypothetical protein K432DRAFT_113033 [Lepidopterella palustris CBS 459.81]